jgi:probable addiction module antidote protein
MDNHGIKLSDLDNLDLEDFDPAEYLTSPEAIAAYINEALASGDTALFAAAVNHVARGRGMADIARESGLAREGLYKALRPGSQPRMETMTRVLKAMGVQLVAQPLAVQQASVPYPEEAQAKAAPARPRARKPAA